MKKRLAAEWEPAIGVIVAWPPSVPKALFQELSKDTTVYLLVPNEGEKLDAIDTFGRWGIDLNKVRFIFVDQGEDYTWPRDWGPQPLFCEDGSYKVMGPRYVYSTPFCGPEHDAPLTCAGTDIPLSEYVCDGCEDNAAGEIARQIGQDFVKLPFAFTGGNILSDGINSILSTEALLLENKFDGINPEEYFTKVSEITGMTNYSVFSDYEDFSLQHVDCLLKILDNKRLLVTRLPKDHPHYNLYENIVNNEISTAVNSYGEPWEIIRMDTNYIHRDGEVAAYVNSLILNKCVYVPLYSIPQDQIALQIWSAAMPGYEVKGFEYKLENEPETRNEREIYEYVGWDPGDVLHCRTRAVWDSQMLYINVHQLPKIIHQQLSYAINTNIVSYSNTDLIKSETQVCWRKHGKTEWNKISLVPSATHELYRAEIVDVAVNDVIEYYVAASDESGRKETMPRTAPEGFYTFEIVE